MVLERNDLSIACEISITARVSHELGNLTKCLAAGFDHAFLLSTDERTLASARAELDHPDDRLRFLTPDAFIALTNSRPMSVRSRSQGNEATKERFNLRNLRRQRTRSVCSVPMQQRSFCLAVQTFAKMRVSGESPPYYKLGRQVLYDRAELDDWVASRKRRSTSDVGGSR